jgi:hypothetical protein
MSDQELGSPGTLIRGCCVCSRGHAQQRPFDTSVTYCSDGRALSHGHVRGLNYCQVRHAALSDTK